MIPEMTRAVPGARTATLASLASLTLLACGACAVQPAKSATAKEPPRVYRLDFVVASGDGREAPRKRAFTMNLVEGQHGDLAVGKNVPLSVTSAPAGNGSARTDVGLRLGAECRAEGDDVLIKVRMEESDVMGPPGAVDSSIDKLVGSGDCLAKLGQSTLALHMDSGQKQLEVSVTPTRLR